MHKFTEIGRQFDKELYHLRRFRETSFLRPLSL
jgi:hypothetical protein